MMILWSVQTEIDKNLLYILNTLPSKKFWTFKTCIKFIFLCKDSAVKNFRGKGGEKRGANGGQAGSPSHQHYQ